MRNLLKEADIASVTDAGTQASGLGAPSVSTSCYSGNTFVAGHDNNFRTTVNNGTINNYYSTPGETVDKQVVIDWLLSDSMSRANHYAIQKEIYSKLAPGTGEWILGTPEFEVWINQPSGTLWGIGIPGAGKTFLASFVINLLLTLRPPHGLVLYAFCRFNDNLSVFQILASLVHRCFDALEPTRAYITEKLYLPYRETKTLPSQSDLETALEEILGSVEECLIIVDALDELREDVCEELITILTSFAKPLFVTSREIELESLDKAIKLRISAPSNDLQSIVDQELKRLPKVRSLLQKNPEELSALVHHIQSKSNGMLLLANLYVAKLKGITNLASLRTAIRDLPTTLYDMYEATLARIRALSDEERSLAHRTILWVVYAPQNLEITELLHALAINPESTRLNQDALTDESILTSVCCGLITVEKETKNVRLIHYTTYEFFRLHWTSVRLTEDEQLLEDPHGFATTICAAYLRLSCFVEQKINRDYRLRSLAKRYPFVDYSCKNLGNHASHSSKQRNGSMAEKLDQYFRNVLRLPLIWDNNFDYGTHLHFAALHGLESLMIESLDISSDKGYFPLFFASLNGHVQMVKRLLQGEDRTSTIGSLDSRNSATETPAADVNKKNQGGMTALHAAAMGGHDAVVQSLLQCNKIDGNAQDDGGRTALHIASEHGHESTVRLLLQNSNINAGATDNKGKTALHYAVKAGSESLVEVLLQHDGIAASVADKNGKTAIHYAAKGRSVSLVQMLLRCDGIDAGATDEDGRTALHYAASWGRLSIVRMLLLQDRIDPGAVDIDGWTALLCATAKSYGKVVRVLLQCDNVDVNAADKEGWTALHYAVCCGPESVIRLLLKRDNINVNAVNGKGRTPLYYAQILGGADYLTTLLNISNLKADEVAEEGKQDRDSDDDDGDESDLDKWVAVIR